MEKNMLAGKDNTLSENNTVKSNEWIKVKNDAAKAEQIEQELGALIDPETLSLLDNIDPEDIIDPETTAILDNIDPEDIIAPEDIVVPHEINPEDIIDPEDIVVPHNIDPEDIIDTSEGNIILPEDIENLPTINITQERPPKIAEEPDLETNGKDIKTPRQ